MFRRKIQLVGGSTYSVSLPKEWVKKSNLKAKDEIVIGEKEDGSLVLFPKLVEEHSPDSISLDIDKYSGIIDQLLFSVYYLGIENITLLSKQPLEKEVRAGIREAIRHMSGTEISNEDKNRITVKVLLDKSKVDINQILYRMGLVLELSIASLLDGNGLSDIRRNEEEMDRMYHLAAKIVSMALIQSETLQSSKIGAASLVPSYFLLCKKLENIGDTISYLAEYISVKEPVFEGKKDILHFFVEEITRSIKYLPKVQKEVFKKAPSDKLEEMEKLIARVKDTSVQNYLRTILRYVVDVEEEAVNISFYKQLIEDSAL